MHRSSLTIKDSYAIYFHFFFGVIYAGFLDRKKLEISEILLLILNFGLLVIAELYFMYSTSSESFLPLKLHSQIFKQKSQSTVWSKKYLELHDINSSQDGEIKYFLQFWDAPVDGRQKNKRVSVEWHPIFEMYFHWRPVIIANIVC